MKKKNALIYSFKHSLPIFISFLPVGLAYGILMQNAGYNFMWTGGCSLFVLAGSLQFLMVTFFAGGTSLLTVTVMALLLNSRHIFYGIPFVEKWRDYGFWKYFLIYSMADESFSLHCSQKIDENTDEKWAYIFNAMFVMLYWFFLSIFGALVGTMLKFNTAGIDFALTALFIVILLDQLKEAKSSFPAVLAAVSSVSCLLIFGPDKFILPSLIVTVTLLIIFRNIITAPEKKGEDI